jgi:hypothetical protein
MAITGEGHESWKSYAVRVPPELVREIEQFGEDIEEEITSNTLRILIAAGLEAKKRGKIHEEKIIIDNAKAAATARLDALVRSALEVFWETPLEGAPDDDDDDPDADPDEPEEEK